MSDSMWLPGLEPIRFLSMEFSRQQYWSALSCPLQGMLPTQGLNLGLLNCRWTLYYLRHQGSPLAIQISPSEKYILIQFAWFLTGLFIFWGFSGSSGVKNACNVEDTGLWVWPLGQEDLLEKEMATHSSILAWETLRTEESGGLQSMGLQRVGHNLATKPPHFFIAEL